MQDYSVCDQCGGHGLTAVPHPGHVMLGEWRPHHTAVGDGEPVYVTAAVCCSCSKGVKVFEHLSARDDLAKPIKLDDYKEKVLREPFKKMAAVRAETARRRGLPAAERGPVPEIVREVVDHFTVPM